jgi:A/G-specific adenine glycosylase
MPRRDPFTDTLLGWFASHGRELPWRASSDPYRIWLSEIILQQTRVVQGIDYWWRFVDHFPDVQSLAEASEDEVLKLWQGLGYYSRARNLHTAAKQIVALGHFPNTFEEIKQLKGVGDYTAAAIASFAFHLPVAAVDGNAYRVLARVFGIDTPINTSRGKKLFAELAQSLLPTDCPHDFNQAMMDFGATWCTPSSPHCEDCPLADRCEAYNYNKVTTLPVKEKKLKVKTRHFIYIYLRCHGQIALCRRPAGDIWQGLYEPPMVEWEGDMAPDETQALQVIQQFLAVPLQSVRIVCRGLRHVLTHRIILADCFLVETESCPALPDSYFWIDESNLDQYAIPRLVERMMKEVEKVE